MTERKLIINANYQNTTRRRFGNFQNLSSLKNQIATLFSLKPEEFTIKQNTRYSNRHKVDLIDDEDLTVALETSSEIIGTVGSTPLSEIILEICPLNVNSNFENSPLLGEKLEEIEEQLKNVNENLLELKKLTNKRNENNSLPTKSCMGQGDEPETVIQQKSVSNASTPPVVINETTKPPPEPKKVTQPVEQKSNSDSQTTTNTSNFEILDNLQNVASKNDNINQNFDIPNDMIISSDVDEDDQRIEVAEMQDKSDTTLLNSPVREEVEVVATPEIETVPEMQEPVQQQPQQFPAYQNQVHAQDQPIEQGIQNIKLESPAQTANVYPKIEADTNVSGTALPVTPHQNSYHQPSEISNKFMNNSVVNQSGANVAGQILPPTVSTEQNTPPVSQAVTTAETTSSAPQDFFSGSTTQPPPSTSVAPSQTTLPPPAQTPQFSQQQPIKQEQVLPSLMPNVNFNPPGQNQRPNSQMSGVSGNSSILNQTSQHSTTNSYGMNNYQNFGQNQQAQIGKESTVSQNSVKQEAVSAPVATTSATNGMPPSTQHNGYYQQQQPQTNYHQRSHSTASNLSQTSASIPTQPPVTQNSSVPANGQMQNQQSAVTQQQQPQSQQPNVNQNSYNNVYNQNMYQNQYQNNYMAQQNYAWQQQQMMMQQQMKMQQQQNSLAQHQTQQVPQAGSISQTAPVQPQQANNGFPAQQQPQQGTNGLPATQNFAGNLPATPQGANSQNPIFGLE